MAEFQLPKLAAWVRFPSPAPECPDEKDAGTKNPLIMRVFCISKDKKSNLPIPQQARLVDETCVPVTTATAVSCYVQTVYFAIDTCSGIVLIALECNIAVPTDPLYSVLEYSGSVFRIEIISL